MKVIIIGGTGFIGKEITNLFSRNEHSILLFHRNKSEFSKKPNIREVLGERKNIGKFQNEFSKFDPDIVIDVIPYTAQDIWSLQKTFSGIAKKIVLLSSGDVYKAYDIFLKNLKGSEKTPLKETSELRNILFPYRSKKMVEYDELMFNYDKILVEKIRGNNLFNTTILRLPAVFGEGDKQQKLSEYINPMIKNSNSIMLDPKKAKWIWTRGYVKNVAHGIYLGAIQETKTDEIYNLGDINLTELEIVEKLKSITNWKGNIEIVAEQKPTYNFSQNIQLDISKAKKVLSYEPIVDLETALRNTAKYYSYK